MARNYPKPPDWFSLMMSDALTDYDSGVPFRESVENSWRRVCRGRTSDIVSSVDMETGDIEFRPVVTIHPPYRYPWRP